MLESKDIQAIIPHRYPFLLLDRVLELEAGASAIGIKNVTGDEYFFQGHFPGFPVMPGVLIVEALAQLGAVAVLSMPENKGKIVFFGGIDGFRFRKQVLPGDTLRLEVTLRKMRGPVGKGEAKALVDGKVVASGELTFAVGNAE